MSLRQNPLRYRPPGATAGELAAWSEVGNHAKPAYLKGKAAYLERWEGAEKPRPIVAAELILDTWSNPDSPRPMGLMWCDGSGVWYDDYDGSDDWTEMAPRSFLGLSQRSPLIFLWQGATLGFHVFLRHLAPVFVRQGFTIYPAASGTEIRAVKLKLGKREWWLCDVGAATGCERMDFDGFSTAFGWGRDSGARNALRLYRALEGYQAIALDLFGLGLKPTVALLALGAARRFLEPDTRWYRPPSLLEAVCRAGGAYRGGYSYGLPYKGTAWNLDLSHAYQWALSFPLPSRSAFGKCEQHGVERDGVYLTRVRGRGHLPAYLAPWSPDDPHFRKRNIWAADCLAFLPSVEYAGLRALGYKVEPGWGFVFTNHVDLSPFTARLSAIEQAYPYGSAQERIARALSVTLYGKLAGSPERTDVCYALEPPDSSWWPFLSTHLEVLENVWTRQTTRASASQHPDAAAVITARVRASLYQAAGEWISRGGSVVYADTDGFSVSTEPAGPIVASFQQYGPWRVKSSTQDGIVLGPRRATLGESVVLPGLSGCSPEVVSLAYSGRSTVVERQVLRAPWASAQPFVRQKYTVRPMVDPQEPAG